MWTIDIPRFHPTCLNQLIGNRFKAGRLKKVDRGVILAQFMMDDIPLAKGPRRVKLTIVLGRGQRGCDPDGYWKSVLDALVHAGALVDDRKESVVLEPVAFERGLLPATRIELTDFPEEPSRVRQEPGLSRGQVRPPGL